MGVCPISVLCGVALLLFAALNACCVVTIVCFVLWAYPMSALHREMWGEQNVLCLPVIVEPYAVMMLVGRLVNRNKWLGWSWMCGGVVGVVSTSSSVVAGFVTPCACFPSSCRPLLVSTPIMIHPHHQHVAHTQPFVDVISSKVLAGGPPVTGRKPSSKFVTSPPALYCPNLVCVCVCVCVWRA